MAERVDAMPAGGITRAKYPWDEWLDGSTWKLTRGTDFICSTSSMSTGAVQKGLRMGLKVETRMAGDTVWIRAVR